MGSNLNTIEGFNWWNRTYVITEYQLNKKVRYRLENNLLDFYSVEVNDVTAGKRKAILDYSSKGGLNILLMFRNKMRLLILSE